MLRRLVATVVLVLCVTQWSGAQASASLMTPGPSGGFSATLELAALIAPLRDTIVGSQVWAQYTGQGNLWAAMHAPPPKRIAQGQLPYPEPTPTDWSRESRRAGIGVAEQTPWMSPQVDMPQDAPLDPLAMCNGTGANARHGGVNAHRAAQAAQVRVHAAAASACAAPTPSVAPSSTPPPAASSIRGIIGVPVRSHPGAPAAPHRAAGVRARSNSLGAHLASAAAVVTTTGIQHWWVYEEGALPGVGKYMVNTGTGNLVVMSDDISLSERGIDLAFRRVYNSQSNHDYAGDDGVVSNYGEGWTSTFDAHLVYNNDGTMTWYDIDGAACTYKPNGDGTWQPCAGEHAQLTLDGKSCGYTITKKTGTVYHFFSPTSNCSINGATGLQGRLYQILARNHNNSLTFKYKFDSCGGCGNTAATLNEIDVVHSDTHQLTLKFSDVLDSSGNDTGFRELQSIVYPDGATTVTYSYNANGQLTQVTRPGNNTGAISENYTYNNGHLAFVMSPRWVSSNGNHGSKTNFQYDNASRVTTIIDKADVNTTPSDGIGQPLQSGTTAPFVWRTQTYTYGMNCAGGAPATCVSQTWLNDTDNHSTAWEIDASGRTVQTSEWTGSSENLWLVTSQGWDSDNNLIWTQDARGNQTDYAYDDSGNTLAVALPSTVDTTPSNVRPTTLYSYDAGPNSGQTNNLLAVCSPKETHALGKDWAGQAYGEHACPIGTPGAGGSGATVYVYDLSDNNQPYGKLTDTYSALGYHHSVVYNQANGGGGDYGLPTQVQGDQINQYDSTTRTPTQNFVYDGYGNLLQYAKGQGPWTLSYDHFNRRVTATDQDGHTSYTCYYSDGSTFYTETPAQHGFANGGNASGSTVGSTATGDSACAGSAPPYADSLTYDQDGDEVTATRHFMQGPGVPAGQKAATAGVTKKYYDGFDRLVEVQQPQDPVADEYTSFPWLTRYIYDVNPTGSITPAIVTNQGSSISVAAYGGLYKTQECVPTNKVLAVGGSQTAAACSFADLRGNAFDALNRSTSKYEVSFGVQAESTQLYDQDPSSYGYLSQTTNAMGQYTTISYAKAGRALKKSYDDPNVTPTENYAYDLDGHATTVTSSRYGSEQYAFDLEGRLTEKDDPTGDASYTDPGTITYQYYPDGMRKNLSLSIPAEHFTGTNALQYAYRIDGLLNHQSIATPGGSGDYNWSYQNSGRELTQKDPFTGQAINFTSGNTSGTKTLQAKTYTYDGYGRIASLTFPAGIAENMSYDAEGEVLADIDQKIYSMRGELVWETPTTPFSVNTYTPPYIANGSVCPSSASNCTFQAQSGQMLTQTSSDARNPNYSYTYDKAGRNTKAQITCPSRSYDGQGDMTPGGTATRTRTYDAENHVLSNSTRGTDGNLPWASVQPDGCVQGLSAGTPSTGYNYAVTATIGWGNSGHPYETAFTGGSTATSQTFHWDGDQLLYATSVVGGVHSIVLETGNLGSVGYFTAGNSTSQLVTVDRDYAGLAVQNHNGTIYSAFVPPGGFIGSTKFGPLPYYLASQGADAPTLPIDPLHVRSDGYQIGGLTIQGVRAYDSTSSQWSTPDAYQGDLRDPMSQKPFVWNDDNPIAFSDPSGYRTCTDPAPGEKPNGCMGGVDWNLVAGYGDFLQKILDFVVFSFAPEGEIAVSLREMQIALHGSSNLRVIGGNPSYLETAYRLGGRAFHVATKTWNSLSMEGKWQLNKAFLDQGIKEGAVFEQAPGEWGYWTRR